MRAHRNLFPGGVCKIKCKADIAGGVWATSQSQVKGNFFFKNISLLWSIQVLSVGDLSSNPVEYLDVYSSTSNIASKFCLYSKSLCVTFLICVISLIMLY